MEASSGSGDEISSSSSTIDRGNSQSRLPKRHTIHSLEEHGESNITRVPSRHSVEISSSERLEEAYGVSAVNRCNQGSVAMAAAARPRPVNSRAANQPIRNDLIRFDEASSVPSNTATMSVHLPQSVEQNGSLSNGSSNHSRPNSAEIGKEL